MNERGEHMRSIHIAIVDDETIQLNYMNQLVNQVAKKMEMSAKISLYESGEAFLFALDNQPKWDLVFLDIQMKGLDGMTVAQVIRQKAPQLHVVFATAYAEYAIHGYEVSALDYLLKPIQAEKIEKALAKYLNQMPQENTYIVLDNQRISLSDIVFIKVNRHMLHIQLLNQVIIVRMTLQSILDQLDRRFVATHRSYLVNLEHVRRLEKQDIHCSNGIVVPLSRRMMKEVQTAFISFYKEAVFYE